jgi:hypothetical protein
MDSKGIFPAGTYCFFCNAILDTRLIENECCTHSALTYRLKLKVDPLKFLMCERWIIRCWCALNYRESDFDCTKAMPKAQLMLCMLKATSAGTDFR